MNKDKFNEIVNKFNTYKDKDGNNLNMHYLTIKTPNQVFYHHFKDENTPSDIRSISKTVITLACGILIDLDKSFTLDTLVYPILKDKITITNKDNLEHLSKLKIKHLLTHTVGYDQVLMMRNDIKDLDPYKLLDYTLNTHIKYSPGSHYLYSNASFYILSATLQEYLQKDLIDFIHNNLFSKLNIKDYRWQKYGDYVAGATRLWLMPDDLLKIGIVFLSKGNFKNERIVSESFIDKMKTITTLTPNHHNDNSFYQRYGYGSGLWISSNDLYFGHGTDGQNLVMIPHKETIILTQANQSEVSSIEKIIDEVIVDYL